MQNFLAMEHSKTAVVLQRKTSQARLLRMTDTLGYIEWQQFKQQHNLRYQKPIIQPQPEMGQYRKQNFTIALARNGPIQEAKLSCTCMQEDPHCTSVQADVPCIFDQEPLLVLSMYMYTLSGYKQLSVLNVEIILRNLCE